MHSNRTRARGRAPKVYKMNLAAKAILAAEVDECMQGLRAEVRERLDRIENEKSKLRSLLDSLETESRWNLQ